jgi:hypothetical protein
MAVMYKGFLSSRQLFQSLPTTSPDCTPSLSMEALEQVREYQWNRKQEQAASKLPTACGTASVSYDRGRLRLDRWGPNSTCFCDDDSPCHGHCDAETEAGGH